MSKMTLSGVSKLPEILSTASFEVLLLDGGAKLDNSKEAEIISLLSQKVKFYGLMKVKLTFCEDVKFSVHKTFMKLLNSVVTDKDRPILHFRLKEYQSNESNYLDLTVAIEDMSSKFDSSVANPVKVILSGQIVG